MPLIPKHKNRTTGITSTRQIRVIVQKCYDRTIEILLKDEKADSLCLKGASATNLRKFRQFYREYPIQQTLSVESGKASFAPLNWQSVSVELLRKFSLSWSHYIALLLVLEFLGIEEKSGYIEEELETAIIDRIESFLLEMGKGFLFESRQKRFTFDNDHFYVDLVFYNRLLRCYVLVDLKRDKLTHQNLGQMQMYVNYFDRHVKTKDELPTIGIVLCHRKNDALVELTLPGEDRSGVEWWEATITS